MSDLQFSFCEVAFKYAFFGTAFSQQLTEGLCAYIEIYAFCQPTTPLSQHSRDISPCTGAILEGTFPLYSYSFPSEISKCIASI